MAMTQEQQKQVFAAVLLVVGLPFGWWKYLMVPYGERIKETSAKVDQIRGEVETLRRVAARKEQLEKQRDDLSIEVARGEKKLPKQKNLEEIIRIVTEVSQKNRVFIGNFNPEAEKQQNYYTEIPFGISYTASVQTLGKFLSAMGQQERIMAARNLNMSFSANSARGHTISGSFTLLAYVFRG